MSGYRVRDYRIREVWASQFQDVAGGATDADFLAWQPFDPTKTIAFYLGAENDPASAEAVDLALEGSFEQAGTGRWPIIGTSSVTTTPTATIWGAIGIYAFASGVFQFAAGGFKTTLPVPPTFIRIGATNKGVGNGRVRVRLLLAELL
jgi:hypothetical protein